MAAHGLQKMARHIAMPNITNDIKKVAGWISHTFAGRDAVPAKQDVPGLVARWLFRIGTIGAVFQIPITAFVLFFTAAFLLGSLVYGKPYGVTKEMLIGPYLLVGYAVWAGWGWRSRERKKITACALFWLASAGFYSMLPIHTWMDSESTADFLEDLWNPILLWYVVVTGVSLIMLLWELFLPRETVKLPDTALEPTTPAP